jgi:hypothetical protein
MANLDDHPFTNGILKGPSFLNGIHVFAHVLIYIKKELSLVLE